VCVWNFECLRSLIIVISRKSCLSEGGDHVSLMKGLRLLRSFWNFCMILGSFLMITNTSSINLLYSRISSECLETVSFSSICINILA